MAACQPAEDQHLARRNQRNWTDEEEADGTEVTANGRDLEVLFASVEDLDDEQRALLQPVE
jgi:hypothetical protein